MQLDFLDRKKNTKAERVKQALKSAGGAGVSNGQLNKITFRYGAIIHNLRKEGYDIETRKLGNDGLYKFIMWREI